MGVEIERKFLLASDAWRNRAQGIFIAQGYLCASETCAVRVRISENRAWLGVKGGSAPGKTARLEFEYPIPVEEAREMLEKLAQPSCIEKTRYIIHEGGLVWEVDEFHGANAGLVMAEVELEREDQPVEKPEWIGEEVTADARYYNASLAKHPFSEWQK